MAFFHYFLLLLSIFAEDLAHASFCGTGAIPFKLQVTEAVENTCHQLKLEIRKSGRPVLGCATPTCFGGFQGGAHGLHGRESIDDGATDDITRQSDSQPFRFRQPDAPIQRSVCDADAHSQSCSASNSWVGGVGKFSRLQRKLNLRCCSYDGMKFASLVHEPMLKINTAYVGGEIYKNGRQIGFDIISDVRRLPGLDGKPRYKVSIHRMPCIPDPPEQYNLVDDGVEENLELALVEEEVPANVASEKSDGGEISSNRPPLFAEPLVPGPIGQQLVPLPPFVQGPAQVAPINFYPAQSAVAYQYYTTTTTPFLCFSADTMVATTNGEKRMDELRIGDVVRTSIATGATFVPIVSFLHRLPEAKANFVRIQTDDDSVLKLTPLHLIQIATFPTMSGLEPSGKLVKAEDVKVGDHLFRLNNNGTKFKLVNVTRITVVSETGAFAPLTSNGYIVVNNLVASCHSVSHATVVQQTFFAHLRLLEEVFWKLFGLHAIDDEGMVELPTGTITIVKWLQYIVPSIPLFSVQ